MQFLEDGYGSSSPSGGVIGKFFIHYADHSQRPLPQITGQLLRFGADTDNAPLANAVFAWEGKSDGGLARFYKATWVTSTPDIAISHLAFETGEVKTRPMLVAITAE